LADSYPFKSTPSNGDLDPI